MYMNEDELNLLLAKLTSNQVMLLTNLAILTLDSDYIKANLLHILKLKTNEEIDKLIQFGVLDNSANGLQIKEQLSEKLLGQIREESVHVYIIIARLIKRFRKIRLKWEERHEFIPIFKKIIKLVPVRIEVAVVMANLAHIYQAIDQQTSAFELQKQASDILKENLGVNHPAVATTLNHLGMLYSKMGKHTEALSMYEMAVGFRARHYGEKSQLTGRALINMGIAYKRQKDYDNAKLKFQRAYYIFNIATGMTEDKISAIQNLANLSKADFNNKGAIGCYKQILDEHKKHNNLNLESKLLSLKNLGKLYVLEGKSSKAIDYHNERVKISRTKTSKNQYIESSALYDIATIHFKKGEFSEAVSYYSESLDIKKKELGETDKATIQNMHDLAKSLIKIKDGSGKSKEAKIYMLKVYEARKNELHKSSTLMRKTTNELAELHELDDELEDAKVLYLELLETLQESNNPSRQEIIFISCKLAAIHITLDDKNEAIKMYQIAQKHANLVGGPEYAKSKEIQSKLTALYYLLRE